MTLDSELIFRGQFFFLLLLDHVPAGRSENELQGKIVLLVVVVASAAHRGQIIYVSGTTLGPGSEVIHRHQDQLVIVGGEVIQVKVGSFLVVSSGKLLQSKQTTFPTAPNTGLIIRQTLQTLSVGLDSMDHSGTVG
jgi:hypothetical protein